MLGRRRSTRHARWRLAFSWLALVPTLLLAAGCASQSTGPASNTQEPGPTFDLTSDAFVWEVSRAGEERTSLFLLGSIHLLDVPISLGPELEQAFHSADVLVVEVDIRDLTPAEATELMMRYGALTAGERLDDLLSEQTIGRLALYSAQQGFSQTLMTRFYEMRPWAIALTLQSIRYEQAGLAADNGVDRFFLEKADAEMRIIGLETLEEQFHSLSSHSDPVQERILLEVLEQSGDEDVETLVDVWKTGDANALTQLIFSVGEEAEDDGAGEFLETLYFARNARMARRLGELLVAGPDGQVVFAVLGAGHLVGDRSVPAMLREQGYTAARMSH